MESSSLQPEPSNIPEEFGAYKIKERIGIGALTELFLAEMKDKDGSRRDVLLKHFHKIYTDNGTFLNILVEEIKTGGLLKHMNIVPIVGFTRHGDDYFVATEYVDGRSLAKVMARLASQGKKLTFGQALRICVGICRGLGYAHSLRENGRPLRIIHRGVTPQNVMITFDGQVKITDFGLSKAREFLAGSIPDLQKGKASYLAPEQFTGEDIDARTDQFAAAAVLWEVFTGKRLFLGKNKREIQKKVMEEKIPQPSTHNPDVNVILDAVILKGLEREPDKRFGNIKDIERELARTLHMLPEAGDLGLDRLMSDLFG